MNFALTSRTAALAALTAMLVAAPVAGAADLPSNGVAGAPATIGCGYSGSSVFAPWGDERTYSLAPDGGFENGAGSWTLGDGAAVTEGNEAFQVGGAADHQSLALPAGSSAASAAFCVSKRENVFRLFVRTDGDRKARLKIEVVYTDIQNGQRSVRFDRLHGDESWSPTGALSIALPGARGRRMTDVSLRFTALGEGDWQIDDVYIDPRLRG
jgi:hypothetical protein